MTEDPGYYLHTPGTLSRTGVLDVGLRCTHSCKFCYYSFMAEKNGQHGALRHAEFRSTKDCLRIIELMAAHGLTNFDITGGEPTLHKGLEEMIRKARQLDITCRIITLGQHLLSAHGPHLLDRLLEAGLTDILFSLHAATEDAFRSATGASLQRITDVMDVLDSQGFEYTVNTVIHRGNLTDLTRIAELAIRHGVYHHNFIAFNAYYKWDSPDEVQSMQAPYNEIAENLAPAVAILQQAGIAVTLRFLPLCVLPDLAHLVVGVAGVHYDPHEWRNRAGNYDREPEFCAQPLPVIPNGPREIHALHHGTVNVAFGDYGEACGVAKRGDAFKIFPEICASCAAINYCDGVDPKYLLLHGVSGLNPFSKLHGSSMLIDKRREYLPAFLVKKTPDALMKAILSQLMH